ncbi:hypothetical protein WN55_06739 [Dufourea novaeangliae]|uniref:Uncharacterized protein n=1 Tax=Dufourea novaeangliae TaxID=178035 RepID=A0A154P0S0_DUFNO|nr:hypothetical protein WN55_06739 [Dufourea novaeangliae]
MCVGGPQTHGRRMGQRGGVIRVGGGRGGMVATAVREGGSVGGFGDLPRREHPPARVLYCDHRYHTTERPRLVLVGVWRRLQKGAALEEKTGGTTLA